MTIANDDLSTQNSPETGWYDLFSRGARDWLRHNDKLKDSVKKQLPDLIAESDVITNTDNRTVRVPIRFIEHYRFRLATQDQESGVGQGQKGQVKPGDILRPAQGYPKQGKPNAGKDEGGVEFLIELKIDEIVEWLWEDLQLPDLKPKPGNTIVDEEYVREGIDRRGARSRLDRRRTIKEAIKRRSVQEDSPAIANEDLRFRQLTRRAKPVTHAVVFFALDASSSMVEESRKLAKSFFFWALQGLRQRYQKISTIFIAHTVVAWEFSEEEFFQVTAQGGTQASSAFKLIEEMLEQQVDISRSNIYLFYASDGDNFMEDNQEASEKLLRLAQLMNFIGYVEVAQSRIQPLQTEMGAIIHNLQRQGLAIRAYPIMSTNDIWMGIRSFFQHQVAEET